MERDPSPVPSLYPALRPLVGSDQVSLLSKATLVDMSHAIEDIVLEERLAALVFTGFQKSTHWEEEVRRYRDLAQVARSVCIFARGDLSVAESVHCAGVTLAPDDRLSQEWFLLVLTGEIAVVLCGQDCHSPVQQEAERLFETIWTFEPAVIARCLEVVEGAVARYRPDLIDQIRRDFRQLGVASPNAK
jgi:DICT domain-containing protein